MSPWIQPEFATADIRRVMHSALKIVRGYLPCPQNAERLSSLAHSAVFFHDPLKSAHRAERIQHDCYG